MLEISARELIKIGSILALTQYILQELGVHKVYPLKTIQGREQPFIKIYLDLMYVSLQKSRVFNWAHNFLSADGQPPDWTLYSTILLVMILMDYFLSNLHWNQLDFNDKMSKAKWIVNKLHILYKSILTAVYIFISQVTKLFL